MTFWTMLLIKVRDGDGKAAADAHTRRQCIEEAADSIPGFVHGETLLSADDSAQFCVMCGWEDEAAYQQWLDSPLRAKQTQDLVGVIDGDIRTLSFQSVHVVNKPQSSSN